jgi:hypothetical protein
MDQQKIKVVFVKILIAISFMLAFMAHLIAQFAYGLFRNIRRSNEQHAEIERRKNR